MPIAACCVSAFCARADAAFGHRLMRDRIVPGGIAGDLSGEGTCVLRALIAEIRQQFPPWSNFTTTRRHYRTGPSATGRLKVELARQYGAGGYVGRASGRDFDARRNPRLSPL